MSWLLGPCAHSVSVCVCGPARCACQRCLTPCTWRGNQSGYRCSSSALPISGWCFCGRLLDRYCSCVVLLSVSLPVPESVLAWLLFGISGGCGLYWILCPSWRLCTAGLTAPALPNCLHLHCVWSLHLHCWIICTSTVFWSCLIKTVYFTCNWILSFCFVTSWFYRGFWQFSAG